MKALLLCAALLCATDALAQRLDHRGSLGLLVGAGVDLRAESSSNAPQNTSARVPLDLGGTMAVGHEGDEAKLVLRVGVPGQLLGSIYGGYRNYFGDEAFKTFFDLDLRADVFPTFTIGPRFGLGAQYELHSLVGIYASLAAHVGAGQGIRFGGEATVGVQLRSYLLE